MILLILALIAGLFVVGGVLGAVAFGLFSLARLPFRRLRAVTARHAGGPATLPSTTRASSSLAH